MVIAGWLWPNDVFKGQGVPVPNGGMATNFYHVIGLLVHCWFTTCILLLSEKTVAIIFGAQVGYIGRQVALNKKIEVNGPKFLGEYNSFFFYSALRSEDIRA